ncbi:hypothetical protein NVP1215B_043 [Vibrio phage 1.215.B._10N.222.54.F7]|nr:hypothetical protein NVP1215A_043 [Vibrio phage 1.215.A._10N.222.54.F7]AUR96066.1 hypothetical protein NVP1215B_043 [Vibrio phage 1.215.B._10N.222.54.F7]
MNYLTALNLIGDLTNDHKERDQAVLEHIIANGSKSAVAIAKGHIDQAWDHAETNAVRSSYIGVMADGDQWLELGHTRAQVIAFAHALARAVEAVEAAKAATIEEEILEGVASKMVEKFDEQANALVNGEPTLQGTPRGILADEAKAPYTVKTYNHLTDIYVRESHPCVTIEEARTKINELFQKRICASIYDNEELREVGSNYPNVYALYGDQKSVAWDLWGEPVTEDSNRRLKALKVHEAY